MRVITNMFLEGNNYVTANIQIDFKLHLEVGCKGISHACHLKYW